MILAFFIPSIQYQWDRYQARLVVQQYVEMGDEFAREGSYKMAEEAFTKAYDLAEVKRLDIEVKRLSAKVKRIYQAPEWGSPLPEGLEEVDFQFLLHFEKGVEQPSEHASILTSYGVYLAHIGKLNEGETTIRKAIALNPKEALAYINLGNLLDQMGRKKEAEDAYKKALALDSKNSRVHYNLGLLFYELGMLKESEKEFATAIKLDPADSDAIKQKILVMEELAN
jgi:tetratricopeptide (TPR) repeat protein